MKRRSLSLLSAALLCGANLFGASNCPAPSAPWDPNPVPATSAYNAKSRIETTGWNVFLDANFIYWNASQENMEMGIVNDNINPLFQVDGNVVQQDFDYSPGFQVGIGGNLWRDGWDVYAQYTWFRHADKVHTNLSAASGRELIPLWSKPDPTGPTFLEGREKWRLSMDLIDLQLGRSYYVGTAVTFRPYVGARGAFIRQYLDIDYLNETTGFLIHTNTFVNQKIHSWGVGPLAGLNGDWMLGKGFRMYGNGSADILFTQYQNLGYKQYSTTAAGVVAAGSGIRVREKDLNYLRTHLAFDLGFGWGDYFWNGDYHVDLSAGYGFQVFFNQNMFRGFGDDQAFNSTAPDGDLFIHGLTASLRVDF